MSPKQRTITSLQPLNPNSPAGILRGFERIKNLEIELPAGDLRLEEGTILKWKAEFGRTLKRCVILAVRRIEDGDGGDHRDRDGDGDEDEIDFSGETGGGLKLRIVWTISALIAASARHLLLREVIRERKEVERLVLRDREGEGTVVMDREGLKEYLRESSGEEAHVCATVGLKNRTTIPAVRMRMMHEARLEVGGRVTMRGATLVVVRPTTETDVEGWGGVGGAFEGVFGTAAEALLQRPSYLLEMNSF